MMTREVNVQIGITRSTVEAANVTPGKHWLSDLIAGCHRARLTFPVCVTAERNHRVHLVVNQEHSTMPLLGSAAGLVERVNSFWIYMDLKF